MRLFPLTELLLAAGLLAAAPADAQQTDSTRTLTDTVEVTYDAEVALDDLEGNAEEAALLTEHLADLAEQPLALNGASAEALAQIPAFSPLTATRIVRFRERHGAFPSLSALQSVEGISADVLAAARPYLFLSDAPSSSDEPSSPYPPLPKLATVVKGLQFDLLQRYTRRIDLGAGYEKQTLSSSTGDTITSAPYLGSPERLYTRFRLRYGRRVSLAVALEKDPGERFAWKPSTRSYGYDHLSGHAAIRDFGRVKTFIAGDFTAAYGQGLILWRGTSFGKGRSPVRTVVRSGNGLSPYASAGENRFFRGLATTLALTPQLEVSAFLSRRRLDATKVAPDTTPPPLGPDLPAGTAHVTTLAESGLHRTRHELSKRDALGEMLFGGALEYRGPQARVGAAGYHTRFDAPLRPDTTALFRRFDFSGQRLSLASLYAQVSAGRYLFFGEAARAPGGALGGLGGVLAEVSRFAEAVVLARRFPRDFSSLHGYTFGERSGPPQNETGFYTGLHLTPHADWAVKGYFDLYHFPWVRYTAGRSSSGYDARLVAEHEPYDWLSWYLQLRTETREGNIDVHDAAGRPLQGLTDQTRQSARLHLDYAFSERLRLRSRIEGVRYREQSPRYEDAAPQAQQDTHFGLLLYQDLRWRPLRSLRLDARLAFFDTDSYAARVYAYENDLLYAFSVPAFSGTGRRFYVLARYAPFEKAVLEVKYAATHFRGVDSVGSGYEEIDAPHRREIRAQVRLRF